MFLSPTPNEKYFLKDFFIMTFKTYKLKNINQAFLFLDILLYFNLFKSTILRKDYSTKRFLCSAAKYQ